MNGRIFFNDELGKLAERQVKLPPPFLTKEYKENMIFSLKLFSKAHMERIQAMAIVSNEVYSPKEYIEAITGTYRFLLTFGGNF